MEKGRHPHVIRTWTVERTRIPYRPPQVSKPASNRLGSTPRQDLLRPLGKGGRPLGVKPPVTGPKTEQ